MSVKVQAGFDVTLRLGENMCGDVARDSADVGSGGSADGQDAVVEAQTHWSDCPASGDDHRRG
jgi:hypothetical protein